MPDNSIKPGHNSRGQPLERLPSKCFSHGLANVKWSFGVGLFEGFVKVLHSNDLLEFPDLLRTYSSKSRLQQNVTVDEVLPIINEAASGI